MTLEETARAPVTTTIDDMKIILVAVTTVDPHPVVPDSHLDMIQEVTLDMTTEEAITDADNGSS